MTTESKTLRVGALQLDIAWEQPEVNFRRIDRWLAAAEAQDVRLLALPETFACGFSMATDRVAEPPGGPTEQFLARRARDRGMWIAGSVPERAPGDAKPFNTLLLVDPDGAVHRYRKRKPFTYGGEADAYSAGGRDLTVEVDGLRISFFICYDLRFADLFWDRAPATDAYVVIANWPAPRRVHWQTLLRARAIENQAYVVATNRVGEGKGLIYVGDSAIIDPTGQVVTSAADQEALLVADLDAAVVHRTREELPFMQDR